MRAPSLTPIAFARCFGFGRGVFTSRGKAVGPLLDIFRWRPGFLGLLLWRVSHRRGRANQNDGTGCLHQAGEDAPEELAAVGGIH